MDASTKNKSKLKNISEDSIPSFIRKTYEILEENKYSDVVKWNDEGTAIIIVNPTEFAQKVLPVYFKHNNLTSFIRQLNMYDFHKKRSLNMDHVYCHDLFQRGKKHLLKEIRRKNSDNPTPSVEKTTLGTDSTQTKQDLAVVVHENVLLKNINQDTLNRITSLESKMKDMSLENQTLWGQIYQLREKENILKNVILNYIRQNNLPISSLPPVLQNEFDLNTLTFKNQKDSSPTFLAQTTTKMHLPSNNFAFPSNYSLNHQDLQRDLLMNPMQVISQSDNGFMLGSSNPQLYSLDGFNGGHQYLDAWNLGLSNLKPALSGTDKLNKPSHYEDSMGFGNGGLEGTKRLKINGFGEDGTKGKSQNENIVLHHNMMGNGIGKSMKNEGISSKIAGDIPLSYR